MRGSVALQNSDCTTIGGQFDLRETLADRSDEGAAEVAGGGVVAMRIGFEESGSLIFDRASAGFRLEVEGVVAGEADFDQAFAAVHLIKTGMNEVAVVENVSGRGHQINVVQRGLRDGGTAGDRSEFKFSRKKRG